MAGLKSSFKALCTPAQLYLVLAIISIVFALLNKIHILAILFKLAFALLWVWFLNYLCSNGLTSVSWFLVLLPYILMLLAFLGFMTLVASKKSSDKKDATH